MLVSVLSGENGPGSLKLIPPPILMPEGIAIYVVHESLYICLHPEQYYPGMDPSGVNRSDGESETWFGMVCLRR